MRFSDKEYLEDWRDNGVFPKIHNDIYTLFGTTWMNDSVCDLCCSTGLLGQRVKEGFGLDVCSIEGDLKWIERGRKYGINIPCLNLYITERNLDTVAEWLEANKVKGLLARRCLSEIFGSDKAGNPLKEAKWDFAKVFTEMLVQVGIEEVWVEGRANQGRSVHPIPDTETEVACLASKYEIEERYRQCAYLVLK